MKQDLSQATVCVIGLGYVGLPLARAFARNMKVIGFDIDREKILELRGDSVNSNISLTDAPEDIGKAEFIIIAVPTPVTVSKEPDLSPVANAARVVSRNMKKGCVVVLESTVYPGCTEEIVQPVLEESGFKCGEDFKIGYSPERINPGDDEHTIDRVTKIVSGMDEATTELVAGLYGKITPRIFKTRDIQTAEAAKVIENVQRDLNIALVNELSIIFNKMGLNTREVLDAAATKWNFHPYTPGLVGGHCIPVDPYYLVYKAKVLGYHPQVILAGRSVNDSMPKIVSEMVIRALNDAGKIIKGSKILILGLTYKQNVADTRQTPVKGIINELSQYGVDMLGYDPLLDDIREQFGIEPVPGLQQTPPVDGVVITVAHDVFKKVSLRELKSLMKKKPVLIDIGRLFDEEEAKRLGFCYKSL